MASRTATSAAWSKYDAGSYHNNNAQKIQNIYVFQINKTFALIAIETNVYV
jgi:hypothetical protein